MYMYMYMCMYMYMYRYIHIYIYAYIYTYIVKICIHAYLRFDAFMHATLMSAGIAPGAAFSALQGGAAFSFGLRTLTCGVLESSAGERKA